MTSPETLPAQTRIGSVSLTVAQLDRSLAFYRGTIGLHLLERVGGRAALGAGGETLVELVEEPGARPAAGHTGLFHVAFLLPDRTELARWLAHTVRARTPLDGASDHLVSEAIYLTDPDGHGVEVYADRPRATWEGRVEHMTTLPLDAAGLLRQSEGEPPFATVPAATTVGHVHLRVARIDETIAFYRDVVGFSLMLELGGQAAFLAAGGYHHHVGGNTWGSLGAAPAPPGTAALRSFSILLPAAADVDAAAARVAAAGREAAVSAGGVWIRDPSGISALLSVPTTRSAGSP
jgi:catechol 2,3-dioxygenase